MISNVTSFNVDSNSVQISFDTDTSSTCTLYWGTDTSYDTGSKTESGSYTSHNISIDSLDQGTKYYYRIRCTAGARTGQADGFSFQTDIKVPTFDFVFDFSGSSYKVKFFGDTEPNWFVHLFVTGPTGFTRVMDVGTDGSWSFMSDHLNPGDYTARIYVETPSGDRSDYSDYKYFTINEEGGGTVPVTPPTEPPTNPPTTPPTEPPTNPPTTPPTEPPITPRTPPTEPIKEDRPLKRPF